MGSLSNRKRLFGSWVTGRPFSNSETTSEGSVAGQAQRAGLILPPTQPLQRQARILEGISSWAARCSDLGWNRQHFATATKFEATYRLGSALSGPEVPLNKRPRLGCGHPRSVGTPHLNRVLNSHPSVWLIQECRSYHRPSADYKAKVLRCVCPPCRNCSKPLPAIANQNREPGSLLLICRNSDRKDPTSDFDNPEKKSGLVDWAWAFPQPLTVPERTWKYTSTAKGSGDLVQRCQRNEARRWGD